MPHEPALHWCPTLDLLEPMLDLDEPMDLSMFNAAFQPQRTDFDWPGAVALAGRLERWTLAG